MVTGDAWEEAVAAARAHPRLAVGLHLVIVSGRSVLPPGEIPHLVDGDGRFRNSPTRAGVVYQARAAARKELRREIRAQLERFRETGLPLSHVDGHLHLHVHPIVMGTLCELASEFAIPAVRFPREDLRVSSRVGGGPIAATAIQSAIFELLRRRSLGRLRRAGVGVADRVYGLHFTGRFREKHWLGLLPELSDGWSEIYCHPARPFPGEAENGPAGSGRRELAALLSPRVRHALEQAEIRLTTSREASGRAGERGATARGGPQAAGRSGIAKPVLRP